MKKNILLKINARPGLFQTKVIWSTMFISSFISLLEYYLLE